MGPAVEHHPVEIRYAKSGGVNIAYEVTGRGPPDLVHIGSWVTHIEAAYEDPAIASFAGSIGWFARVVNFDKRGVGLSDRVPEAQLPTM